MHVSRPSQPPPPVGFRAMPLWSSAFAALGCLIAASPAGAQAVDYSRTPERYLNVENNVAAGFCFFDQPDYVCVGKDLPYVVIAKTIPAGPLKAAIEENCSGLDAAERNPSPDCRYGFRFVPRTFKRIVSDYAVNNRLRRNAKIVEFHADILEPKVMTR